MKWSLRIAGISPTKPGFEEFQVKPQMGDLTSVQVTVETRYGLIKADFQRKGKRIRISIEVPEGTSAVVMDKGKSIRLESGKHQISIKV